jgi:PKD repeat protein
VLADVDIFKSIDRGVTWAGTTEAYGHLNASSDRQWIKGERIGTGGANQVLYEMDHELASEDIRFAASINDSAWSPPASGITEPEMILPPNSTFPNTNPGPVFIDKTTHMVYGVFTASTIKTNRDRPPFGKLPNVWAAFGPGTTTAGVPPGPFVNRAAFRGVFDSPTNPAPPAGSQTFGSNAANDFPSATIDNAGNIYVVWATQNARTNQMSVWFSSSHDHGQNFYGPFEVAKFPAPPAGSAEMPWIAAGDKGRIAIVYYQTNEAGDPNSTNLHWNTMFAQSLNADSREPVFTISQVSDHVMHFGPICNLGLLCASGTRELLDFFSVAIGPDGLANINFADTGNANSPSHVTYARQLSGPLSLTNPTFPTCTGAANAPPVAVLTATPTSGPAPLTVTFDGSGSFDQDLSDTIVRYTFDFGDGTPVVTQGAPMVQHTYANPGTFTATLVVTDSRGVRSQNTAQQVITVTPGGNSSPTPTATATATASPTATATATASPTPTATATASPTPTSTATASATATATATASPTPTATATASPIPTATATASPTPTATATASPSATATATASPTATPSATPTATPVDVELLNISGRVFTKTGDKVGIGGFIISGTGTKRIMARAIGPSLSVNGKLQDPFLEIHDSNGSEPLTNDNWRSSQEAEIQQTGLAPTDDRESAVVKRLPAGNYTAIIRGADGGQGIGVVELYDLSGTDPGELGNLSVRADVGTGDNVLFNGLILRGGNAKRVLFRALGPSVKVNGSTVPGALPDPVLELHDGNGGLMATNDNWKDAPNAAQIQATGLAPPDDHESAILMTLSNGNVTTIVRGVGNTTGIALAEAYKLD